MRILMLTSVFPPHVGGVESHVYELTRALVAAGHEVDVVSGSTEEAEKPFGFPVHRPKFIRAQMFYDWQLGRWLKNLHRGRAFDIAHVHGLKPSIGVKALAIPAVFTNHTSGFLKRLDKSAHSKKRSLQRIAHFQEIIAPSEELCEASRSIGYHGPVSFIPNGVDVERFVTGRSALRAQWGIPEERTTIVMARRLHEKNGVRYFAEAVALLKDENVHIVVAGDGDERTNVERIIREAGMSERVTMLGAVNNNDMPDIYRACDISVLPSLMEATSITGLESMACGLALVGTNVGGIPALIEDGKTGFLVPPREPKQMAEKLRVLIADAARCKQMGAAAREKAVREFSWPVIAAKTVEVYQRYLT